MARLLSPFEYFSQGLQTGSSFADSVLDRKDRQKDRDLKQEELEKQHQHQQRQLQQQDAQFQQNYGLHSDQFQLAQDQFSESQRHTGVAERQADRRIGVDEQELGIKQQAATRNRQFQSDVQGQILEEGAFDAGGLLQRYPDKAKEISDMSKLGQQMKDSGGKAIAGKLYNAVNSGDKERAADILKNEGGVFNRILGKNITKDLLDDIEKDPSKVQNLASQAYVLSGGKSDDLADFKKVQEEQFRQHRQQYHAAENVTHQFQQYRDDIQSLLDNPRKIKNITGPLGQVEALIPGTSSASDRAKIQHVIDGLGFEKIVEYKGKGITFGSLTERELEKASNVASAINPKSSSWRDLQTSLIRMRDGLDRSLGALGQEKQDTEYDLGLTGRGQKFLEGVQNKKDDDANKPPAAPEAAPTSTPLSEPGLRKQAAEDFLLKNNTPKNRAFFQQKYGYLPQTGEE